jgi:hypothetical protein
MGQSAFELQSWTLPMPPHMAMHVDCGIWPPKARQHTSPFGQFALLVHESPRPMHCPCDTHVSLPPPPPPNVAQHSCVLGSQLIFPQVMGCTGGPASIVDPLLLPLLPLPPPLPLPLLPAPLLPPLPLAPLLPFPPLLPELAPLLPPELLPPPTSSVPSSSTVRPPQPTAATIAATQAPLTQAMALPPLPPRSRVITESTRSPAVQALADCGDSGTGPNEPSAKVSRAPCRHEWV